MKTKTISHRERVLRHLKLHGHITSLEAIREYGNTRLAATIFLLREAGHEIRTETVEVPTRYGNSTLVAKYHLEKKKETNQTDIFNQNKVEK